MKNTMWRLLKVATLSACLAFPGCDDGPTGPHTVMTIAGNWHGSLHPGIARNFDPCLQPAEATASIRQDGVRVSGTVTTASANFPGGNLEGEFRSSNLSGTLQTSMETISVTGGAVPAGFGSPVVRLTINFFSPGQCGPNTIELER